MWDEIQKISSKISQVQFGKHFGHEPQNWFHSGEGLMILAVQDTSIQQKEHSDLLAWLSPLNFWTKQNDIFSRRQEGTGVWLLEDEVFRQWLSGVEKTLWCPGIRAFDLWIFFRSSHLLIWL